MDDRGPRVLVTGRLHLSQAEQQLSFQTAERVFTTAEVRRRFTQRREQVVDVDGLRVLLSPEQLLLQPLAQCRVGLDAPLQLQPQVSDLQQQLAQVQWLPRRLAAA